jgi:glycosyltransferase involved in cell wall biosynthesis
MPDPILVSIITPSYNQGEFLEQTLLSVLEQDYPHIEYIVMDGGSTDNSLEVIQRYAHRLAYWESQPDRGQAHAINKGLQRATGEILGWLNSDDVLLPDTVRRAVETFRQHPDVDVVYGRLERMDDRGQPVPTPLLPKDRVVFDKQRVIGECVVNQPGSFWQRRIQEEIQLLREVEIPGLAGPLDESLVYVMDFEYWIRLALAGAQFMRLAQVVARFRLSSASKTVAQSAKMAEEQWRVLEKLLATPDLPARLGLSPAQVQRQARRTFGVIALHAFWGCLKQQDGPQARRWLTVALRADPSALFQRRWLDLAWAGLRRKLTIVRSDANNS